MERTYCNLNQGFNPRKALIILSLVFIVGYGLWNARGIILGPEIYLPSIAEASETSENPITIQGRARNVVFLSLNQRPIFIDTEGNFKERLLLEPGFNIIRLYGRDRFRQETVKEIKIYYRQTE